MSRSSHPSRPSRLSYPPLTQNAELRTSLPILPVPLFAPFPPVSPAYPASEPRRASGAAATRSLRDLRGWADGLPKPCLGSGTRKLSAVYWFHGERRARSVLSHPLRSVSQDSPFRRNLGCRRHS